MEFRSACSLIEALTSNLMLDLCRILGITKLNTTEYHPQCDGAVERFNRTLKTILRKHVGCQLDRFLPGVLWAYRNTPHTSTGEKPSFLLYGIDCRSPTEAAYLPTEDIPRKMVRDILRFYAGARAGTGGVIAR